MAARGPGSGVGGAASPSLRNRDHLAQSEAGQLRVLLGAVLGVLESPGARVLHQLRIVLDRIVDRVDAGGVAAGADDERQGLRRRIQLPDLDVDRVARPVADNRRRCVCGGGVLRLQADLRGADVLAIHAGADQGVDQRPLAFTGLIHRPGDIRRDELDGYVGGQRVRDALDLAGAHHGDLPDVGVWGGRRPGR